MQLKRSGNTCEVVARVTPEHKVTSRGYRVTVVVDEELGEVQVVQCHDCVASQGGCKHGVALLMWLHRRSSEPSVTDVQAYWNKPRLSLVGSSVKAVPAGDLRPKPRDASQNSVIHDADTSDPGEMFFQELLEEVNGGGEGASGLLFDYFAPKTSPWMECSLDRLLDSYLSTARPGEPVFKDFIMHCKARMSSEMCGTIAKMTTAQSHCKVWHSMRFGRVTASKLHEAARCKTEGGSLVMSIIGATKLKDSLAMRRGREMEPLVLDIVAKKVGKIERSGLLLRSDLPIFGASPDGLTRDGKAVVEVKCPSHAKHLRRYINEDLTMVQKHRAQVQLLMLMSGRDLAFFCVADPSFPEKKDVYICRERYDASYCHELIQSAAKFWCGSVFPELVKGRAAAQL